jgi:flagellar motor switch protein FliN
MSEEENLPSAEDMRARYADLMKEDAPAEKDASAEEPAQDESAVDSPQSAEPEPDPEPEPAAAPAPAAAAIEPLPPVEPEPVVEEVADPSDDLTAHLLDVNVRLWAELGRAKLPLAQAVSLGEGAIVDLDKEPEEALDVLVNGLPFAKARLLLVDGEWAIRLEEIVATPGAVEQASSSGSGA